MASRTRTAIYAILLLISLGLAPLAAFAAHNVLIVFDEDKDLPGLAAINRGLREGLRAEFDDDMSFFSESLQLSQFGKPEYDVLLQDYFRRKYDGKRVDLVVAVMEPSLDFVLRHRDSLFAGVPIVFCGVDS